MECGVLSGSGVFSNCPFGGFQDFNPLNCRSYSQIEMYLDTRVAANTLYTYMYTWTDKQMENQNPILHQLTIKAGVTKQNKKIFIVYICNSQTPAAPTCVSLSPGLDTSL